MDRAEKETSARYRTAIVVLAPVVLLAAFVYHPFLANLTNSEAAGAAARADTLRWGIAHVGVALGSALMIPAFIAIREFLRDAGEDRHSARGLPLVAFGAALYAILPGIELGAMAAGQVGADVARMEEVLEPWFVPLLMSGALVHAIGLVCFARAVRAARVLGPTQTRLAVTALVVMALARFVPLGAVQFYMQGVAGVLALWTIARAIRGGAAEPALEHAPQVATM